MSQYIYHYRSRIIIKLFAATCGDDSVIDVFTVIFFIAILYSVK